MASNSKYKDITVLISAITALIAAIAACITTCHSGKILKETVIANKPYFVSKLADFVQLDSNQVTFRIKLQNVGKRPASEVITRTFILNTTIKGLSILKISPPGSTSNDMAPNDTKDITMIITNDFISKGNFPILIVFVIKYKDAVFGNKENNTLYFRWDAPEQADGTPRITHANLVNVKTIIESIKPQIDDFIEND